MRISDWSSDVCSSDLRRCARGQREVPPIAIVTRSADLDHDLAVFTQTEVPPLLLTTHDTAAEARARFTGLAEVYDCSDTDPGGFDLARKSVVKGKSVSVRVDLGGRCFIKKKKK